MLDKNILLSPFAFIQSHRAHKDCDWVFTSVTPERYR